MADNLILFGAGASYGSDKTNTPALGENLIVALQRFNPPGWGQVPSNLAKTFKSDFEAGMEQLAGFNSHWMPVLQRAMAAYFFAFQPAATNLYCRLAQRILYAHWNGACATLNYERLLELSLIQVGIQPVVGCTPNGSRQIELCLPHGCCHIFCDGIRGSATGISFSGVGITTDGPVSVISNPAQFAARINGDAFPPVMSYFEPQKATTSGASFILRQRARWSELVEAASVIGIIGVRVRPCDTHIWSPLEKTKAKLIYCGGPSSAQEFEQWHQTARPSSKDTVLRGYFADEFDHLCKVLNLL